MLNKLQEDERGGGEISSLAFNNKEHNGMLFHLNKQKTAALFSFKMNHTGLSILSSLGNSI